MPLFFTALLGIGNFALHKAVLESGHPMLAKVPWLAGGRAGTFSMVVEFLVLVVALWLVADGQSGWGFAYLIYSLANGFSAWLILSNRV
ncbi:hypothetical protein GRI97_00460 [Altererythrobacter xixiisoli]|uniref:Uncharacterized protein n=1 Tax=Croceibacterium xixiisoli TaxID=1476466 RepID=A0A6I4TS84_9SPHN|nr:hypothetical protein [Croceibacterium xixiisoli]MXO97458.1 hypothetical protein [Croceibacterium xixiisoli]